MLRKIKKTFIHQCIFKSFCNRFLPMAIHSRVLLVLMFSVLIISKSSLNGFFSLFEIFIVHFLSLSKIKSLKFSLLVTYLLQNARLINLSI